jgi:hypothetical protein
MEKLSLEENKELLKISVYKYRFIAFKNTYFGSYTALTIN